MTKCSINGDFGQCKNKPTIDIFGIELCDNHRHILFNMSDNTITKLPNKTSDTELIINDPDDGSWVGR